MWAPMRYSAGGPGTNGLLAINLNDLDFGFVLTNSSKTLFLTVSNAGGGMLEGVATVTSPFQVVQGGSYRLGSNQSQIVAIKFQPTVATKFSSNATFTGGGGGMVTLGGVAYTSQPGMSFNSTEGTVLPPFVIGDTYISQPRETDLSTGGTAIYGFKIAEAGVYMVSAKINAPSGAANSLVVHVDGQPIDPVHIWDIGRLTTGFEDRNVSGRGNGTYDDNEFKPRPFSLSAGSHYLVFRGREANLQLGAITIAPFDPALVPSKRLWVVLPD